MPDGLAAAVIHLWAKLPKLSYRSKGDPGVLSHEPRIVKAQILFETGGEQLPSKGQRRVNNWRSNTVSSMFELGTLKGGPLFSDVLGLIPCSP